MGTPPSLAQPCNAPSHQGRNKMDPFGIAALVCAILAGVAVGTFFWGVIKDQDALTAICAAGFLLFANASGALALIWLIRWIVHAFTGAE